MNAGIVLCGGRSVRMGRPKAWLPFDGEPMLARIARIVSEAVDLVVVVAAPGQELPALPSSSRIVRDDVEGRGPLNGFAAGLASLPDSTESVFLTSCDVPLLKQELITLMFRLLDGHDIAVPVVDGVPQPLLGAYRTAGLLGRVKRVQAAGRGGVVHLLDGADVRRVEAEEIREVDPELGSLRNVNTIEDYESAVGERPAR